LTVRNSQYIELMSPLICGQHAVTCRVWEQYFSNLK